MCKLLIAAVLASAAVTPLVAAQSPQNKADVQQRGAHHGGQGAGPGARERSNEERHVVNSPRPQVISRGAPDVSPQVQRRPQIETVQERRHNVRPPAENRQITPFPHQPRTEQQPPAKFPRAEPRIEDRQVTRGVPGVTRVPTMDRRHPPAVSRVPRIGTEPALRPESRSRRPQWNRDWRNNRTYDWQVWRQQHRSVFRMHRYRDPYGWAYQMFTIGWRLWPNYYSSGYWIADPWTYRLPPAPPGTRWIRYYNDALLVDTWTGEVIDVVHDVFW